MGPHPAVAQVRRAVRHSLTNAGPRVLVACSGGADSLALAAATAFEAPRAGLRAGLLTIDHGMQSGSAAQAARVAELGFELGLDPVEVVPVDVTGPGGPEAAARSARYAALERAADALDASVLLGHTRDDQAETVLLGLGRGSGPRSIAGMRLCQGRYLRPLLEVPRASTTAACAALGLPIWDDPHNSDAGFRRVRLRREVLPLLEDVLAGGVAAALARTAQLVREDLDALDGLAAQLLDAHAGQPRDAHAGQPLDAHAGQPLDQSRNVVDMRPELDFDQGLAGADGQGLAGVAGFALDAHALSGYPRALRTRVLRLWAGRHGAGPLTATHLHALDALVSDWHGQGPLGLPGGLQVTRASGRLEAYRPESMFEE